MTTITADDIWSLYRSEMTDVRAGSSSAALVIVNGTVEVWSLVAAEGDSDTQIVLTDGDLWTHCDGELDDSLAAQLAADLTARHAENKD